MNADAECTAGRRRRPVFAGGLMGVLVSVAAMQPALCPEVVEDQCSFAARAAEPEDRRVADAGPEAGGRPRLVVRARRTAAGGRSGAGLSPTRGPAMGKTEDEAPSTAGAAPGASGIHLFPPPGTKPPRAGIVVPDDFELPPGYVRHYQTTDDGKPLGAILMFHPDYEVVDELGNPVDMPEDRVVPAEMAPPGLPLAILEVPPVVYPTPPAKDSKRLPGEQP